MLKIAICDDDKECIKNVEDIINISWKNRPSDLVLDSFENGYSLVEAHFKSAYDIIILDVLMPMVNGIKIAEEIREKDSGVKIIFTTFSKDYAIDSYSVKANNYLLKPIEVEKLTKSLDEIIEDIGTNNKGLLIKGAYTYSRISFSDIEYIEAQNKKVVFSLSDGRIIEGIEPLYTYKEKLNSSNLFYQCHRSYIVNLFKISTYTLSEITMKSGARIPISRRSVKDFEEVYFSTLFGEEQNK